MSSALVASWQMHCMSRFADWLAQSQAGVGRGCMHMRPTGCSGQTNAASTGAFKEALDALLDAAAKRLPAAAWAADAGLRARADAWRQRARRAMLLARQLAPAGSHEQDEALALLDMELLQGLPPAYDQRCRVRRTCCTPKP